MADITVEFEGRRYVWTGTRWYGERDYLTPPLVVISQLNALIAEQLAVDDDAVTDPDELLERATQAREADGQLERALCLAHRALETRPEHAGTAAVLCSILRELDRPQEALEVADRFKRSRYPPVLTSRAAALCDLERWEEALRQVRQVIAICNGRGGSEALAVLSRIKANAPELVDQ